MIIRDSGLDFLGHPVCLLYSVAMRSMFDNNVFLVIATDTLVHTQTVEKKEEPSFKRPCVRQKAEQLYTERSVKPLDRFFCACAVKKMYGRRWINCDGGPVLLWEITVAEHVGQSNRFSKKSRTKHISMRTSAEKSSKHLRRHSSDGSVTDS